MIPKVGLIVTAILIGFCVTVGAYMTFAGKHIEILSPISTLNFSLSAQPSKSLNGRLSYISGDVLWQSRIATQSSLITTNRIIQQGEEIDTGSKGKATLSLGTVIATIASNSQLAIIQTLPNNIVLNQKDGFLQYKKSDDSIPFSVRGLDLLINLHEGESSVQVSKDISQIQLVVINGSAEVAYTDTKNMSITKNILPGQRFIFNNNTKKFVLLP